MRASLREQYVTSENKDDDAAASPTVSSGTSLSAAPLTTRSSRYSLRQTTRQDYSELAGEDSNDSEQETEEDTIRVKKVKLNSFSSPGNPRDMELIAKNRFIEMLKREIDSLKTENERLKQEKENSQIQRSKQPDAGVNRYYMFSPAFSPIPEDSEIKSELVAANSQEHYILSFKPPSPSALVLDECTDPITDKSFSPPQCRK